MSSICAVVVTFNRCDLLRRTLRALQEQTRPLDHILVVDNASTDNTRQMIGEEFPHIELLALPENIGGSGGFHDGMAHAFASDQQFDWLWIMDDDGMPEPDCLEKMLDFQEHAQVLVPLQKDSTGILYGVWKWNGLPSGHTPPILDLKSRAVSGPIVFSFVGPMISRTVVEAIGLPQRDLFIRFDDVEYSLRVLAHKNRDGSRLRVVAVTDAIFHHGTLGEVREVKLLGRTSYRSPDAAWKTYYQARNNLWTLGRHRSPRSHHRLFWSHMLRHLVGDLLYEPDRFHRARLRLMGLLDAKRGRLGKRI